MSDQPPRTLVRPGGGEGAARLIYDRARAAEITRERAQLRAAELDRLELRLAVIDADIAGLQRLRWKQLEPELRAAGFNVDGQREPLPPHPLERAVRQRRGQPPGDPTLRARQEEAADRGRLVRTFTPPRVSVR